MKFEAGFLADNTYGVRHINRLVRSLVTKGIVDYPFPEDESEIGTFNINGFVQFLSEDGVIPETHKSMLVEKTDTGYILNPGMAFLDNGIYIFLEIAQEFSSEPLMKVYWMHDTLTDKVEFMCTAEYPTSGSYLPLAEILEDGTVSNVRKCARAKLPGMASDYNRTKHFSISENITLDIQHEPNTYGMYGSTTIDLGGNVYKYFLIHEPNLHSWCLINWETGTVKRFVRITGNSSNTYETSSLGNSTWYFNGECVLSNGRQLRFEIQENGLLEIFAYDNDYIKPVTILVEFELYVF